MLHPIPDRFLEPVRQIEEGGPVPALNVGMRELVHQDGGQALARITLEPDAFDLLITDHSMPGMTGVELASASRKLRPSLPILLATGYAEMPEGIQLDLPRLTKPYQQDQLRDLLNKMLSEQRQPLAWSVPTT